MMKCFEEDTRIKCCENRVLCFEMVYKTLKEERELWDNVVEYIATHSPSKENTEALVKMREKHRGVFFVLGNYLDVLRQLGLLGEFRDYIKAKYNVSEYTLANLY